MNQTEHLTYKERIARIGQLLAKGVTLMLMCEAEERRQAEAQASVKENPIAVAVSMAGLGDDHRKILEYLNRVGKASPREMQDALEISKTTLFRRLTELQEGGLVVRSGKSAAVRYRLSPQASRSAKQTKASAPSAPPPGQGRGPNQP